ncbi:HepT-like ribonuclease domain-containing protein [Desulfurispora thermophila]|uniref:HepT-like ribonuclease domain-containing protein n=1 Tax=Desulfurispora thermophila TaxID=265470 RepID=UPI00036C7A7A|nr:DUF86 domain-containing protein [Desulfurispora thermophila]
MKLEKDRTRLLHILESATIISYWMAGISLEAFLNSPMLQAAVIRHLEIIGEATKHITSQLKMIYPEIPWKHIAGMRDVLIHEYFGVDLEQVWITCNRDIPKLTADIQKILSEIQ